MGKVAVLKDISKEQIGKDGSENRCEEERKEIKAELILIKQRWGSSREEAANKDKCHC